MLILTAFAAFFVAILSGMGVGGGGLLVIWLTLVAGKEQLTAQGINLLFFLAASLSALAVNLKKRKFDAKRLLLIIIPGIAFAVGGSVTAKFVGTKLLRRIFGGLLCVSGVISICSVFNTKSKNKNNITKK